MYLFNLLAEDFRGAPDIFWGIFTFVLGPIIVFAGMAILVLVVSLVAKAMTAKAKKKETAEETETVEAVTETTVEEDGIPESRQKNQKTQLLKNRSISRRNNYA